MYFKLEEWTRFHILPLWCITEIPKEKEKEERKGMEKKKNKYLLENTKKF